MAADTVRDQIHRLEDELEDAIKNFNVAVANGYRERLGPLERTIGGLERRITQLRIF